MNNSVLFFASKTVFKNFVSTWNTANTSTGSSASTQVKLPLISTGVYNFTVDWGDGNSDVISVWNQAEVTHTYVSSGTYTISINGTCKRFGFNNTGDRLKLMKINSWGSLSLYTNQGFGAFWGCANLTLSNVSDVPDLSYTGTSLSTLFRGCTALTIINNSNSWDVSLIQDFYLTFYMCSNFDSDLSSWDMSSATRLQSMFLQCSKFNSNISNWNVSNVTDMYEFLRQASAFNRNINNWDVRKVTDFYRFLYGATAFNQPLNNWKPLAAINMFQFMTLKTAANYSAGYLDSIYNSWSLLTIRPNVSIDFGTIKHTAAGSAGKAILQGSPSNWIITDGGI